METTKIKIKIGDHEFEAEGPTKVVQEQFEVFKKLIGTAPQVAASPGKPQNKTDTEAKGLLLDKICRVEGRLISLTVKPKSEGTAALIIMLAQRAYRDNETVTASEIKDGLEQSGYRLGRLDKVMKPLAIEGSVVQIGAKKGTRYRLTNQGTNKARTTAMEEIAEIYIAE